MAKQHQWDTDQRFETARDWVTASIGEGVDLSDMPEGYIDRCVSITKKRHGIFSLLRSAPKDIDRALFWHAFHIGRHAVQWGNLAPWRDGVTMLLMRATPAQRDQYETDLNATFRLCKAVNAARSANK